MMNESISDIVKDIDCLQETRQQSVRIEHNWSINNIFNLIASKRPGDKIESEQFSFETTNKLRPTDEIIYCSRCQVACSCQNESKKQEINTNNLPYSSSMLTLNTEMVCNCFLANALWRLEINRSQVDSDYISINLMLLHSQNTFDKQTKNINHTLPTVCQNCEHSSLLTQTKLILKLKIYLLNAEMNELFEKQTLEISIDLKCFFQSLLTSDQQSHKNRITTKLIEKFSNEKFCRIKELLSWLNKRKSADFCLLTEFKVYVNQQQTDLGIKKSRSSTRLFSHNLVNTLSDTVLLFNYKHAWIIKNWRHFLMQGSQSHTFMNETEINNMLASNKIDHSVKFGKFRSKLFNLLSRNDEIDTKIDTEINTKIDRKIEGLLKNVKWKLQLYPNGYSPEFEKSMSLFVNFSHLTGELAQYATNSKAKPCQNNAKQIEETFYDNDEHAGLILLIKSPVSTLKTGASASAFGTSNEFNEDSMDNEDIEKSQETFVKASFQISIMDSNSKRVDKCQSEKQLFELFGSWGYKEYMTLKDLTDAKEKYLTQNFSSLNLNCKIVLFYTLTTKRTNLVDFDCSSLLLRSKGSSIITNSSCSSLPDQSTWINELNEIHHHNLLLSSASSLTTSSSSSSSATSTPSKQRKFLFPTKNDPLRECNTLVYDLRRIFKKSEMCDAIIKSPINLDTFTSSSGDSEFKKFKVHKLILAVRSQVFEKMFNNDGNKNSSLPQQIKIVDFDAQTVEIFLNYLYTDKLELSTNENDANNSESFNEQNLFIELYKIADKYSVHRLKQISESKLIKSINCETCIELLILAYLHNSSRLKLQCFKHLSTNVNRIVTQSGWSYLEKNYPCLLAEAFRVLYLKKN